MISGSNIKREYRVKIMSSVTVEQLEGYFYHATIQTTNMNGVIVLSEGQRMPYKNITDFNDSWVIMTRRVLMEKTGCL